MKTVYKAKVTKTLAPASETKTVINTVLGSVTVKYDARESLAKIVCYLRHDAMPVSGFWARLQADIEDESYVILDIPPSLPESIKMDGSSIFLENVTLFEAVKAGVKRELYIEAHVADWLREATPEEFAESAGEHFS